MNKLARVLGTGDTQTLSQYDDCKFTCKSCITVSHANKKKRIQLTESSSRGHQTVISSEHHPLHLPMSLSPSLILYFIHIPRELGKRGAVCTKSQGEPKHKMCHLFASLSLPSQLVY